MSDLTPNLNLPLPGAGIFNKRLADIQAVKSALVKLDTVVDGVNYMQVNMPGNVSTIVGTARNYPKTAIVIKKLTAWVSENVPASLAVSLLKNGVPVGTVSIVAGSSKATIDANIAVGADDYLTMDVLSGTGKDLVLRLEY